MKKKICLLLLFLILPFAFLFSGCDENVKYNINFIVDEEVYATVESSGNEYIRLPNNPSKDGYEFVGWYLDKDTWEVQLKANTYENTKITINVNVFAYFREIEKPEPVTFNVLSDISKADIDKVSIYKNNVLQREIQIEEIDVINALLNKLQETYLLSSDYTIRESYKSFTSLSGLYLKIEFNCNQSIKYKEEIYNSQISSNSYYTYLIIEINNFEQETDNVMYYNYHESDYSYVSARFNSSGNQLFNYIKNLIPEDIIEVRTTSYQINVGENFMIDLYLQNINSDTEIYANVSNSNIISRVDTDGFVFKAISGGETTITISSNLQNFEPVTINVAVGDGNIYTPYFIKNANELAKIGTAKVEGTETYIYPLSSSYKLMSNISLNDNWTPIGLNSTNGFTGIFDFNGYSINNLVINNTSTTYSGLFAKVGNQGKILSAIIYNTSISTNADFCGIIAGKNSGEIDSANIYNARIQNNKVDNSTNWIVGLNEGLIKKSFVINDEKLNYVNDDSNTINISELIDVKYKNHNNIITSINKYAFKDCKNLKTIIIPYTIEEIGEYAFTDCEKLENIIYQEIPNFSIKIENNKNAESIVTANDVANATATTSGSQNILLINFTVEGANKFQRVIDNGTGYFYIGTNLPFSLSLSNANSEYVGIVTASLEMAEKLANEIMQAKTNIYSGLTRIKKYAFDNCTAISSIIIPNSVTSIGEYVFEDCNSLTIYCEATYQPNEWNSNWNSSNRPVYWYSENQPTTSGNYWHYVDGIITKWTNDQIDLTNDISLIKILNTQLAIAEIDDGKNQTMYDALQDMENVGYYITNIKAKSEGNQIVWDQTSDSFVLIEIESGNVIAGKVESINNKTAIG